MAGDTNMRPIVRMAAVAICKQWDLELVSLSYPEDAKPIPDHPVDGVAATDGPVIVIEHTLHQSFPDQVTQRRWFAPLGELVARISGTLPGPGRYELGVDAEALKRQQAADFARIEAWVWERAPNLTAGRTIHGPTNVATGCRPDLPFRVRLVRHPPAEGVPDGFMLLRWSIDLDDLPDRHTERMRATLRNKLPKLHQHVPRDGRTVLILENDDIELVNDDNVTTAIKAALTQEPDLEPPGAIVVVHTIGKPWGMTWIKDHDEWYPDIETRGYVRLD